MGMTLDKLLDETGANDLAGRRHIKTAAAKPDFAKLAERCRRAATATPEERAESDGKDLAEKTAAVEIIRRTIAEIDALDAGSEKTAEPRAARATDAAFIKAALEAGHQPEEIAEFLEKQAKGNIRRFFGELGAGLSSGRAAKITEKSEMLQGLATRKWQSAARKYEGLGDDAKAKFLDKLRVKYGDKAAHEILKGEKGFQHLPGWKDIQKSMPKPAAAGGGAGGDKALGISVGGNQLGFSKEQLNAAKKPAMYLGAGVLAHRAITNRSEPEKKKSGVVVVNS